jgi:hypothetical protein
VITYKGICDEEEGENSNETMTSSWRVFLADD